ncbi:hypothetical protein ACWV27_25995 (plasmid) [Massilia varians]|jgi:hypothetical protein|uniref:hypothetical protein n=1 Tax=Massilia sp. X63 TaxID=3237285 RepID=UPI0034DDC14F
MAGSPRDQARGRKSLLLDHKNSNQRFFRNFADMKIPSPNPKYRRGVRFAAKSLLVVSALVALDLCRPVASDYELREALVAKAHVSDAKADFAREDKCGTMPGNDDTSSAAWRSCTLDNFAAAKTVPGAFYQASRAHMWLQRHPHDDAMRAHAQKAIDAGWDAYSNNEALYALHDQFEEALNRSMTVALFGGKYPSTREIDERLLEDIEMAIAAAALFETRGRRRAANALARNAAEVESTDRSKGVERNEGGAG